MRRRAGFTLVEVLIASLVLLGVSYGLFHLFRSTNRQASQAAWISAAQKQLRSGLKRINDELSKASYWTEISPGEIRYLDVDGSATDPGSAAETTAKNKFALEYSGSADAESTLTADWDNPDNVQQVLTWYQSQPRRTGFSDDEAGALALCAVYLRGNALVFQRDATNDADGEVQAVLVTLMNNVEEITTLVSEKTDAGEAVAGSIATIRATLRHPNRGVFPNARITQEITARVPVGFPE